MKPRRPGAPVGVTNLPPEALQVRRSKNWMPVRIEASGWGMMNAIHNAFVNPLLIDRGAGPIALGIFNSGANLFLYSFGFVGPRLAYKVGGLGRAVMGTLFIVRLLLILLTAFLWALPDGAVVPLLVLVLIWTAGEGLVIPLWTAFIAGLVPASQRGQRLAMRGASTSAASAGIMIALLILMQFQSKSGAVTFAHRLATISGLVHWTGTIPLLLASGILRRHRMTKSRETCFLGCALNGRRVVVLSMLAIIVNRFWI